MHTMVLQFIDPKKQFTINIVSVFFIVSVLMI